MLSFARTAPCFVGLSLLIACAPSANARYRRAFASLSIPSSRQPALDDDPFAGVAVLERRALVDAVLSRNPDVGAARAGWRRALSRVPQETALENPTISYSLAPLSIAGAAALGQRVEIEQKVPITNRRGIAGEVALAEADAAGGHAEEVRLHLAAMASALFDDYYVAARARELDVHHRSLLEQMRASVVAQYTAGRAAQPELLQADLELAMLDREQLMHETERKVVTAQLNGLLHRHPDAPLPPPPDQLAALDSEALDEREAMENALRLRPELQGQAAKIRRGEAAEKLAALQAWPDVGVMASYDSMWEMPEHRWMIGLSVEVPLDRGRRAAARDEAEAEAREARFLRDRMTDDIRVEVSTAIDRLSEARAGLALYEQRIMPAAQAQVEAVGAGYLADQSEFQAVLAAQRSVRHITLERERARADVHRRRAELELALGRLPGGGR